VCDEENGGRYGDVVGYPVSTGDPTCDDEGADSFTEAMRLPLNDRRRTTALGGLAIDRDEPAYDWTPPASCEDDPSPSYCARPAYGGEDTFHFRGALPFVGLASDLTVPGLGVGLALYVPMARGGTSTLDPGPASTHLREANVQPIHTSLGASYAWHDVIGFGAAVTWIHSSWYARIDNQTATSLRDYPGLGAFLGGELDGAAIEDPDLLVATEFGPLIDDVVSFQAGLSVKPHPEVMLSVSYVHGARVDHQGDVGLSFGCPDPGEYPLVGGPLGAPSFGLCDAQMSGKSTVGYRYPQRIHAAVAWTPDGGHSLELMGGFVRWSQYTDFEITVTDVESQNTEITDEVSTLLSLQRKWARDNRDTFWLSVDGKVQAHEAVLVGGRATFDRAAVPDEVMSPNNSDFDTLRLGALLAVQPSKKVPVRLSVSYLGDVSFRRTITTSAFRVDVEPDARLEDRYMYPEMNGEYRGWLHRLSLGVQGDFNVKRKGT
jgi:long-subunit fatty acid transport protein